jgi:hypothetical protein
MENNNTLPNFKVCIKCNLSKEISLFRKGNRNICLACQKEYSKKLYSKYKLRKRELADIWIKNNREHVRQKRKEQYNTTKKISNIQSKSYYQQQIESPKGIYNLLKKNALKRKISFEITLNYFINWYLLQKQECYYCKRTKENCLKDYLDIKRLTIDRINNAKGYIEDNLCLSCYTCNTIKGNLFNEKEMLELAIVIQKILERRNN